MAGYFSVALLARSSSDFDAIRSELDQQVRRYNDSKTDYNVGFPSGLLSQLDTAMGSGAFQRWTGLPSWPDRALSSFLLALGPGAELNGRDPIVRPEAERRDRFCVRLSGLQDRIF